MHSHKGKYYFFSLATFTKRFPISGVVKERKMLLEKEYQRMYAHVYGNLNLSNTFTYYLAIEVKKHVFNENRTGLRSPCGFSLFYYITFFGTKKSWQWMKEQK